MPDIVSAADAVSTKSPSKGDRERLAFARLLPSLLSQPQYSGQFVAIHDEKVIDHDADDIELVKRVHARVGYVPIHVARVIHAAVAERLPHYREYRGAASK